MVQTIFLSPLLEPACGRQVVSNKKRELVCWSQDQQRLIPSVGPMLLIFPGLVCIHIPGTGKNKLLSCSFEGLLNMLKHNSILHYLKFCPSVYLMFFFRTLNTICTLVEKA
jgi:hypothetical protein